MPKEIYNVPLCKYRQKKKRLQQFNMYIHMYLASLPIRPQGTGSRLPPPPSPRAPLSTYLYLTYLYLHIPTCYLHGSSFLLHVLKKAKRLKESFSESVSSVCYLLPPRKTCLKRDVNYLPLPASSLIRTYIIQVGMYDLVYNTLSLIPYTLYRSSRQVSRW